MLSLLKAAAIVALLCCGSVNAAQAQNAGEQLVVEHRCNACHSMSEPLLGPPYIAIASRHSPDKEIMIDVLARKIVHGGGGTWGLVPMVPNQWVSIEQAREMAQWILSLNPPDP